METDREAALPVEPPPLALQVTDAGTRPPAPAEASAWLARTRRSAFRAAAVYALAGSAHAGIATVVLFVISGTEFLPLRTFFVWFIFAWPLVPTVFFVAVGAVLLTRFLALTGVPVYLGKVVGDWSGDPLLLVIAASAVYIVLGMFLDPLGVMLITLPLFLPMFVALDLDVPATWQRIVVEVRLPRVVAAGLVGASLAYSGASAHLVRAIASEHVHLRGARADSCCCRLSGFAVKFVGGSFRG